MNHKQFQLFMQILFFLEYNKIKNNFRNYLRKKTITTFLDLVFDTGSMFSCHIAGVDYAWCGITQSSILTSLKLTLSFPKSNKILKIELFFSTTS